MAERAPRYAVSIVTAGPARICVRSAGEGEKLVLLPGLGRPVKYDPTVGPHLR